MIIKSLRLYIPNAIEGHDIYLYGIRAKGRIGQRKSRKSSIKPIFTTKNDFEGLNAILLTVNNEDWQAI